MPNRFVSTIVKHPVFNNNLNKHMTSENNIK